MSQTTAVRKHSVTSLALRGSLEFVTTDWDGLGRIRPSLLREPLDVSVAWQWKLTVCLSRDVCRNSAQLSALLLAETDHVSGYCLPTGWDWFLQMIRLSVWFLILRTENPPTSLRSRPASGQDLKFILKLFAPHQIHQTYSSRIQMFYSPEQLILTN